MAAGKLHVMQVIRTLDGGGAELVLETLALGLDRRYFDVTICELLHTGEKAENLRALGFDVVSLVPHGRPRRTYVNFVRLGRLARKRRVDVIHTHHAAALADAVLGKLLGHRAKVVHTFHFGNYPHGDPSTMRLERAFNGGADALVAVGHGQAASICATYALPPERLRTIWNGIPTHPPRLDHARLDPYVGRERVLIGMIGTLFEQKGHTDMLAAAALLKQRGVPATFLIVGGGPLRNELEDRCRALGLQDTVHFLGWVKDAGEVLMPGIDIFFQPSRWEAMSMVLLEAAAAEKPIVCTAVGEATRLLAHEDSALILDVGDVSAMAEALERLVVDEPFRRRLGQRARSVVEASCTADAMVRNYERVYRELTGHAVPSEQGE
ncbi:MAG: glycosyltransferase [Vicinamibacterales bacterium]